MNRLNRSRSTGPQTLSTQSNMSFGASTLVRIDEDRVMEGLRVPPTLDTVQNVTFVLTQEPGKLKPKDLKAAIERNRAEKEQRAEEQRLMRAEGGGAGMLDLRGILSEERMNSNEGDPFKRQLREMAFLADVDDVEKLEIEKGFRISEDYLGSSMLSQEDIDIVYKQRKTALLHKKRAEWRSVQARNHTGLIPPTHPHVKAGTSAEVSKQILAVVSSGKTALTSAAGISTTTTTAAGSSAMQPPHFDPNRNDIWAKRMNSLRKLISFVSKWLIRKRVRERMAKVMNTFAENGAHTREEIRAYIESSSAKAATKGAAPASTQAQKDSGASTSDIARPANVFSMVLAEPNPALLNRESNAAILAAAAERVQQGQSEITADMARRILFPQCNPSHGGSGNREVLAGPNTQALIQFDDRTFFQLKVKPDYLTLGYLPEPTPVAPVYFPVLHFKDLRLGAPEEGALRPPADNKVDAQTLQQWVAEAAKTSDEPGILTQLRETVTKPATTSTTEQELNKTDSSISKPDATESILAEMPAWLCSGEDEWSAKELNYVDPVPSLRVFGPVPRRSEFDADWSLRPDSEQLVYVPDQSLRSRWCRQPGFLSANIYLLGNAESRNADPEPMATPLLSDYHLLDNDRHASGLCCYRQDHLRAPLEQDGEIKPLQRAQDKKDYLTDSESDNEDGYGDFKPTMEKVKKLLVPPPPPKAAEVVPDKGKGKDAKKGAAAPTPAPVPVAAPLTNESMDRDNFSVLGEDQRREEQVELLRDRKTLDLESTILRTRKNKQDEFTKKLCELSAQSRCLVQALPVQLPFHSYEEEVYALMEPRMPVLNPLHVELDLTRSTDSLGNFSMSMSPSRVL